MELDQFMKELSVDYLQKIVELFFPDEVYPEVNKLIINPLVEQGRQQGEESGLTRGLQDSIQQILLHRFQELPEDFQKKISSLTDVQKLRILLEAV